LGARFAAGLTLLRVAMAMHLSEEGVCENG
jgi:hypothetical protein